MENDTRKPRKKLSTGAKVLLIIAALIVAATLAVLILGSALLGRLTRGDGSMPTPDPHASEAAPTDEVPDMTATPTRSPAATVFDPSTTPSAGATPNILPLSEYYHQTHLSVTQLEKMAAYNASEEYIHVLLIGSDTRAGMGQGSYRSDTMMIATLDKANNRIKLTTLMRDMLVDIPGHGYDRLNSAVAKGGVTLLFDTIEHNFHLKVDKYALVDFFSFRDIIDLMGGITIKMTAEEISAANDCIAGLNKQLGYPLREGFIYAEAGPVKLSGKQALGYARIRKLDSEYKRVARQYTVLNTAFAQFLDMGAAKQYSVLYDAMPLVETNLTNADIIEIVAEVLSTGQGGILYYRVPVEGLFESGKWNKKYVFFCDFPATALKMFEFIFDSDDIANEAALLEPNPSLPQPAPTAQDTGSGGYTGGLGGGIGANTPAP